MKTARRRVIYRRCPKGLDWRAGITLAESAFVLLVVAILMTLVFGIVGGMLQITTTAGPDSKERGQAFLALENIRTSLAMTYFNKDLERRLVFLGARAQIEGQRMDRITFACVHPYSEEVGLAAVRDISFVVAEREASPGAANGQRNFTLFRREDYIVGETPGRGGKLYPLVDNVISFQIRYSLNGKDWRDDWRSDETRRIPRLVQVQLKVRIGDRTEFFETIAAPGLYIR